MLEQLQPWLIEITMNGRKETYVVVDEDHGEEEVVFATLGQLDLGLDDCGCREIDAQRVVMNEQADGLLAMRLAHIRMIEPDYVPTPGEAYYLSGR